VGRVTVSGCTEWNLGGFPCGKPNGIDDGQGVETGGKGRETCSEGGCHEPGIKREKNFQRGGTDQRKKRIFLGGGGGDRRRWGLGPKGGGGVTRLQNIPSEEIGEINSQRLIPKKPLEKLGAPLKKGGGGGVTRAKREKTKREKQPLPVVPQLQRV